MVVHNEALMRALRRFELLADASDETLAMLSAEAGGRRAARGVCLWRSGMRADQVILVRNGYVSMRGTSGSSGRSIYAFVGPGEVSGAESALCWGVRTANAYVSSERADLLVLETSTLSRAARGDAALRRALEGARALGHASFEPKLRVLYAGPPQRRLATLVMHLAERHGRSSPGGVVRVQNAPPLADLAAYAGLSAEAANEHFDAWVARGLVRLDEGGLVVESKASFEALAHEPGFRSSDKASRSSGVIRRSIARDEPARVASRRSG